MGAASLVAYRSTIASSDGARAAGARDAGARAGARAAGIGAISALGAAAPWRQAGGVIGGIRGGIGAISAGGVPWWEAGVRRLLAGAAVATFYTGALAISFLLIEGGSAREESWWVGAGWAR